MPPHGPVDYNSGAASALTMKPKDTATTRILVADDQQDVREALRLLLKGEGFAIDTASSPLAALEAAKTKEYDALLIDLNYTRDTTSGREGLDLLARLQGLDATLPVVVMTAWGSVDVAVEAMRRGARDFVQKPWDNPRLLSILRTQVELGRALRRGQRLEAENLVLRGDGGPRLVAESAVMRPIVDLIQRVGPSDANVLATGENGSGKGVVAQALHAVSRRSTAPLVTVNAAGFSEGVFESELFGHVKGAFTDARADRVGRFELADGGTLFLLQHAARYRKTLTGFDDSAMRALLEHRWPGNVRELDHAVERSVLMGAGPLLSTSDLALRAAADGHPSLEEMSLEEVESFLIRKTLARHNGNVSQAAEALGLSRSALYRRLQRYRL